MDAFGTQEWACFRRPAVGGRRRVWFAGSGESGLRRCVGLLVRFLSCHVIKGRFEGAEPGGCLSRAFGKTPVFSGQLGLFAGDSFVLVAHCLLGGAQRGHHVRQLPLQAGRSGFQSLQGGKPFVGLAGLGGSRLPVDGILLPCIACICAQQRRFTAVQPGVASVCQLAGPLDRLV